MYILTIRNLTRAEYHILGVNRREGRVPLLAIDYVVNLSDTEWTIAQPGLDTAVANGVITYSVVRDGVGHIQTTIDLGEDASDADLQEDFSLGNNIPAGAVILSASARLEETADGPAHTAITCEILVGANSLFSAALDIRDATASVNDSQAADQNINTPLVADSAPILRVDTVDDDVGDLTQGQVLCTIIYFNPAQAS